MLRTTLKLFALALALWLTWLLLAPALPQGTQGVPDWLAHIVAFGALVWAACIWLPRAPLAFLAASVVGYGGMIELIQPSVGRTASWSDLLMDGIGAALACAVLVLWRRRQGSSGSPA